MKPAATRVRPARERQRGLSMVEMAVASAVFATLMGTVFGLLAAGQRAVETGITRTRLEGQARQVLDRLANDLRSAQLEPFEDGGDRGSALTYRRRYGTYPDGSFTEALSTSTDDFDLAAGAIRWDLLPADQMRLQLSPGEVDNGLDDDGNGIADDSELVSEAGGRTTVLCRNVAPGGLTFRLVSPKTLEVSLRLEALDGRKNRITARASTLIFLRN